MFYFILIIYYNIYIYIYRIMTVRLNHVQSIMLMGKSKHLRFPCKNGRRSARPLWMSSSDPQLHLNDQRFNRLPLNEQV